MPSRKTKKELGEIGKFLLALMLIFLVTSRFTMEQILDKVVEGLLLIFVPGVLLALLIFLAIKGEKTLKKWI